MLEMAVRITGKQDVRRDGRTMWHGERRKHGRAQQTCRMDGGRYRTFRNLRTIVLPDQGPTRPAGFAVPAGHNMNAGLTASTRNVIDPAEVKVLGVPMGQIVLSESLVGA
jgi:hypothetical protein